MKDLAIERFAGRGGTIVQVDVLYLEVTLTLQCFYYYLRLFLHDDIHDSLNEVRRHALEDMREKSGAMKGTLNIALHPSMHSKVFHKPVQFLKKFH